MFSPRIKSTSNGPEDQTVDLNTAEVSLEADAGWGDRGAHGLVWAGVLLSLL